MPVYYVVDVAGVGPRLYREFHAGTGSDKLQQAVSDAVGRAADDPDYHSDWPAGTTVAASTGAGTITLDLTGASLATRPAAMTQAQARAAIQQLVYTAQAATQKIRRFATLRS